LTDYYKFREIFYYLKWIVCFTIIVTGFAVSMGYGTITQFYIITGIVLPIHILFWVMTNIEKSKDDERHAKLAKKYREESNTVNGSES